MNSSSAYDVAVIGGGLAGGIAAYHLAKQGMRTILFEKDASPRHRVCGEFISAEGIPLLKEVGIDFEKLDGQNISGFRLHGPTHSGQAQLPRAAVGVSRKRLDEELLSVAMKAGAEIRRGVSVREIKDHLVKTSDGDFSARAIVVATGKSEFKMLQTRHGRDSGMVGFKMHLQLTPQALAEIRGHCDLFVFKNGYGGLLPIEDDQANFCFLIESRALRSIGGNWPALSSYIAHSNPLAAKYLENSQPKFPHPASVASIPYGFVKTTPAEQGVYCVGDQMAVIPSLTGDGMTIALHTGRLAARSICESTSAADYQNQALANLKQQVARGFHLHLLFKSPFLCDRTAQMMPLFPKAFDFIFSQTRYRSN